MYHTMYMHYVFLLMYIIIIQGFHRRPLRTIIVLQNTLGPAWLIKFVCSDPTTNRSVAQILLQHNFPAGMRRMAQICEDILCGNKFLGWCVSGNHKPWRWLSIINHFRGKAPTIVFHVVKLRSSNKPSCLWWGANRHIFRYLVQY